MRKTTLQEENEERSVSAETAETAETAKEQESVQATKSPEPQPTSGNGASNRGKKPTSFTDGDMPEEIHCHRCRTLMENGVCPACGYKIYVPMDSKKRNRIRLIATIVGFAIFVILFVILQMRNA